MRYWLIALFSIISFSASAQWFHIDFKKKHEALPLLKQVNDNSFSRLAASVNNIKLSQPSIQSIDLGPSRFSLEVAEAATLKIAKHNMRFRVYHEASYNFSDLANLYIQLHRLSEAKWYFLQSNQISREENDDKHTISNLVSLAMVKVDIGDIESARADLFEARTMARAKGFQISVAEIEGKLQAIDQNPSTVTRAELKYAENTGNEKKAL